ncbi:MAG: hypothetical protein RLO11_00120 [Salinisphaeraceae bacterium]
MRRQTMLDPAAPGQVGDTTTPAFLVTLRAGVREAMDNNDAWTLMILSANAQGAYLATDDDRYRGLRDHASQAADRLQKS